MGGPYNPEHYQKWYHENHERLMAARRERKRARYHSDPEFRSKILEARKASKKARYWADPEYRTRSLASYRERLRTDDAFRAARNAARKLRYQTDPAYRLKRLAKASVSYADKSESILSARRKKYAINPRIRQLALAAADRRRARISNVPHEPIDRIEIAVRDNWRCHICGKRVVQANMSLDHLIPISRGGPHLKANVALAHL